MTHYNSEQAGEMGGDAPAICSSPCRRDAVGQRRSVEEAAQLRKKGKRVVMKCTITGGEQLALCRLTHRALAGMPFRSDLAGVTS